MNRLIASLLFVFILAISCKKNAVNKGTINLDPEEDGPGAMVVITGEGFGTDIKKVGVWFNGLAAAHIDSVSDKLIIARVPEKASTGKVEVTANGNPYASPGDFTILTGSWVRKADFLGPASISACSFAIGNKGYAIGGAINGGPVDNVVMYDPSTDRWTAKKNFSGNPIRFDVGLSIGNKGYVMGMPRDNIGPTQIWEYDPVADSWTRKKDFPGKNRVAQVAFAYGDKMIYGLGYLWNEHKDTSDLWLYDPANDDWKTLADFPSGYNNYRSSAYGITVGNKAYIKTIDYGSPLYAYDSTSDLWSEVSELYLPDGATPGKCFAIGSQIVYIFMGRGEVYIYDTIQNSWTHKTSEPDFVGSIAFSIADKVYSGLGTTGDQLWGNGIRTGYINSFWEFSLQ